jgi:ribulose bisphosphate carboxylase small subunit
MLSGYKAQVEFTECKFPISPVLGRWKMPETIGTETTEEVLASVGYQ